MKSFEKLLKKHEIGTQNNVRGLDSHQVSPDGATFPNEQELRKITADWPVSPGTSGRTADLQDCTRGDLQARDRRPPPVRKFAAPRQEAVARTLGTFTTSDIPAKWIRKHCAVRGG